MSLVQIGKKANPAGAKPGWLKVPLPTGEKFISLKARLRAMGLHTVCEEARCPNIGECWSGGTATLMVLGDVCTRHCRFCAIASGNPKGVVDRDEPRKSADIAATMDLKYVVLTAVDRDDLPDGGAAHFAATVTAIKERIPGIVCETLTGDFQGDEKALAVMLASGVDVFAHNLETVRRLQRTVRDARAGYEQTLFVLRRALELRPEIITKTSLMLGLGETDEEVLEAMRDLRAVGVRIITLGQYLRPTEKHLPIIEYVTPDKFAWFEQEARKLGFDYVASGPLVRSSYRAAELFLLRTLRPGSSVMHTPPRAAEAAVSAS